MGPAIDWCTVSQLLGGTVDSAWAHSTERYRQGLTGAVFKTYDRFQYVAHTQGTLTMMQKDVHEQGPRASLAVAATRIEPSYLGIVESIQ